MSMKVTLGCDPELFMIDPTGKLRASCGLIGGTKHKPQQLPLGEGFCVQEDNVAVEFNIPPAETSLEFVGNIQKVISFLKEGIKEGYGFDFAPISAASFPEDELQNPAAQVFGCDPDYNAWTGKKNPRPNAEDKTLRSCGGHIHVGYDKSQAPPEKVIRCMDFFLGVPSVEMDMNGARRRALYGKYGAYRDKSFGVEYRTLSNFWVFSPSLIEWAWRNTERAVQAAVAQFPVEEYQAAIESAIDKGDMEATKFLVNKFNLDVVHV